MKHIVKTLIKSLLPESACDYLREHRRKALERRYFRQPFTRIRCGAYPIEVPRSHPLVTLHKAQPYRDLCAGIAAKYMSEKYPDATIMDIGANIGDTAALMATYARNKLMLVEASDYYFDILVRNASQFPNETVIKKVIVGDGREVSGAFRHWGGTASFHENDKGKQRIPTERLSSIADENTCFIKIDTDGYDFKILADSLEWLAAKHPAILFENQIRNSCDYNRADELYVSLIRAGYAYFIVWDDPGYHLVSTTSLDVLKDLDRYLYKVWQHEGHKSICNYDVLCLHASDQDVYLDIGEWYKTY